MSRVDQPLLFIAATLVLLGVFVLSSASVVISQRAYGTPYLFTLRQITYALVFGSLTVFLFQAISYRFWRKVALPLLLAALFLSFLVFLPKIGIEHGGARRWINLFFITIQPAEILKFAFIVYLSTWLDSRRSRPKTGRGALVPFIVMMGVLSVFLIQQPDIGTLGIILGTSILLYFLGGGKMTQVLALVGIGLIVLCFLVLAAPYRLERFKIFLDPNLDPSGSGYQMKQSLIAIGSGGFWGKGFGKGIQKYNYLPEPIGDSVFAIFGEEMGFVGAAVLLGLFLLFLRRGIYIAEHAPDFFGTLLAFGFTIGILVQAVVNIGAISGMLPLTGVPLPFISYGGTSLITNLAGIGILLNISKHMS